MHQSVSGTQSPARESSTSKIESQQRTTVVKTEIVEKKVERCISEETDGTRLLIDKNDHLLTNG